MASSFFTTNCITIVCAVYILIILIMFFLKGRTHKIASRIFFALLICTLLVMIVFTTWGYLVTKGSNLTDLFGRLSCFLFVFWDCTLTLYTLICFGSEEEGRMFINKYKKIIYICCFLMFIINILACIFLRIEVTYVEDEHLYMIGGPIQAYFLAIGVLALLATSVSFGVSIKKVDKITKALGICCVLFTSLSFTATFSGIMVMNDICFLYSIIIMFLYLSIESHDGSLLEEFNDSKEKAEESNRLKSEFIMNMSHQLRTPMNTILGFSDSLLTSEKFLQSELIDDTSNIEAASKKLFDLVNSILDISKLESNKETLNDVDYKLETVIYDISSNINALITKENLTFNINVNEDVYNNLNGDDYKLSKVLNIFLANAVRYTNYGEVSLNVSCDFVQKGIYEFVFHIKNTGHGMKKKNFDITFEDLIKLNSENNNEIDTDILRIIVAKGLLGIIGGNVEFSNENGNNTEYIIKVKQRVVNDERIGNIREKIQTKHSVAYERLDLSNKKCLIVDDERINTIILGRLLKQYKIKIDSISNPRDAVDKVAYDTYDIIFVNHDMEDMSGVDFVKKLEATGNKIPSIVALTSVSDVLGDESVYTEHIICPVEFKSLNKVIKNIFEEGGAK